jgi:hypothetical protein
MPVTTGWTIKTVSLTKLTRIIQSVVPATFLEAKHNMCEEQPSGIFSGAQIKKYGGHSYSKDSL